MPRWGVPRSPDWAAKVDNRSTLLGSGTARHIGLRVDILHNVKLCVIGPITMYVVQFRQTAVLINISAGPAKFVYRNTKCATISAIVMIIRMK